MTAAVLAHPDYEAYLATMRAHCCEDLALSYDWCAACRGEN